MADENTNNNTTNGELLINDHNHDDLSSGSSLNDEYSADAQPFSDDSSNVTSNTDASPVEGSSESKLQNLDSAESSLDNQTSVEENSSQYSGPVPVKRKLSKNTIYGIIAGSIACIIIIVIVVLVSLPRAQDLPKTTNIDGLTIAYPEGWNESGTFIYAPEGQSVGQIFVSSNLLRDFDKDSDDNAVYERLKSSIESLKVEASDLVESNVDGYPVIKCSAKPQRYTGSDTVIMNGYVFTTIIDNYFVYCTASVAQNASSSDLMTMEAVVNNIHIDPAFITLTYKDEAGNTIGTDSVLETGSSTSFFLPTSFEGIPQTVISWRSDDSGVTLETNQYNLSTQAKNLTKDTVLTPSFGNVYTVTFTDGQGKTLATKKVIEGNGVEAPDAPTRTGYNFVGWDAEFNNITGDMTVNAVWKEKPKIYNAGTYRVGPDIPAGEYVIESNSSTFAYFCVYPDTSKSSILENNNFTGREYVTVSDGQLLEVVRANFYLADGATPKTNINTSPGTYKVGFDIPAGEYRLTSNSTTMAYYAIYNSSAAGKRIVQNNNFDGQDYVRVSDGQYLELVRCTGSLV